MPNEHFCLKWNNFQRNIVAALGNLKVDEDFVDVTISCEGKLIKAHKVILSACSDYFRDLFRENPCQHPVIILRDASYTDVEGLVRYVYRGEVDVQPQHLQSFLKTADALKIKGLADQGLVPDHQQGSCPASTTSSNGSANAPVVDKSDESEPPPEDDSLSAFESQYNNSSPRIEPLRVPIPPSNFRSNCSNSSNGSSTGSSVEDSIILQPEPKRMRMGSPTPNLPLNLVASSQSQQQPPLVASLVPQHPSIFNPSPAAAVVLDATGAVPLVKPKKPDIVLNSEEPYPPPSQSPLFLQQPNSPKHISSCSSQVETGSLAADSEEAFSIERKPSIKLTSPNSSSKKKKTKKELHSHLPTSDSSNSCSPAVPSAVTSAANSTGQSGNSLVTSMANLDDQSADNNNTENGNNGHPRNRWRCMQPRLCNYCWKTFSNSFNLKQHIVNVHIQSQGVSCSLCDKVVKNKWYLRKHLVTAHGAPLKRVTTKSSKENGGSPSDNNPSTVQGHCDLRKHFVTANGAPLQRVTTESSKENGGSPSDNNMGSDITSPGSTSTTSLTLMHSNVTGQGSPNSSNSDQETGIISATIEEKQQHNKTNVNNSAANRLSTTC